MQISDYERLIISTANRYFSVPEKLHILAKLTEGLLTDAQAINKYQLSPKLLWAWRKWWHLYILKKYNPRTVSKPKKSAAKQLKDLECRNRELQKEIQYQKLRADALEKLIEVGERELNISIRNKSGSKRSRLFNLPLPPPNYQPTVVQPYHTYPASYRKRAGEYYGLIHQEKVEPDRTPCLT